MEGLTVVRGAVVTSVGSVTAVDVGAVLVCGAVVGSVVTDVLCCVARVAAAAGAPP